MKIKQSFFLKLIAISLCLLLSFEQSGFAQIAGQLDISRQLTAFRNTFFPSSFRPVHLRFMQYSPATNNFQLLLDKENLKNLSRPSAEKATEELLSFFLIGISLPNDSFWVNLRPDSPGNIIDPLVEKTDIGKVFLEADVQLKKDTAKATSPETPEGKQYWERLYAKAEELFGSQNVTIPTLIRPWIVPDEIIIRETSENAYIYKATLKVMLEQDYLNKNNPFPGGADYSFKDERLKQLNEYAAEILKETIIPNISREINTSKRYARLRQVYYSLILAQWFKKKFRGTDGFYASMIDGKDINRFYSKDAWLKDDYFKEYQKSFKDGEYNYKVSQQSAFGRVLRSYYSGGIAIGNLDTVAQVVSPGNSALPAGLANGHVIEASGVPLPRAKVIATQQDTASGEEKKLAWKVHQATQLALGAGVNVEDGIDISRVVSFSALPERIQNDNIASVIRALELIKNSGVSTAEFRRALESALQQLKNGQRLSAQFGTNPAGRAVLVAGEALHELWLSRQRESGQGVEADRQEDFLGLNAQQQMLDLIILLTVLNESAPVQSVASGSSAEAAPVSHKLNIHIAKFDFDSADERSWEKYNTLLSVSRDLITGISREDLLLILRKISGIKDLQWADISQDVDLSYFAEGAHKYVYRMQFALVSGEKINILLAAKKEVGKNDITSHELQNLKRLDGRGVPKFAWSGVSADGRRWYIEEFIEGETAQGLLNKGLLTERLRRSIVYALLTITFGLGGMAPRDMHGGNFIIRKGSQEAVMVDIGDNRLYIGGKSANAQHRLLFLAMIMSQYGFKDYGSPGTDNFIFDEVLKHPAFRKDALGLLEDAHALVNSMSKKEIKDLFLSKGRNMFWNLGGNAGNEKPVTDFTEYFINSLNAFMAKVDFRRGPPETTFVKGGQAVLRNLAGRIDGRFVRVNARGEIIVNTREIASVLGVAEDDPIVLKVANVLRQHEIAEDAAIGRGLSVKEAHTEGMIAEAEAIGEDSQLREAMHKLWGSLTSDRSAGARIEYGGLDAWGKDGVGYEGEGEASEVLQKVAAREEFRSFISRTGESAERVTAVLEEFLKAHAEKVKEKWDLERLLSSHLRFLSSASELEAHLGLFGKYITESSSRYGFVYLGFSRILEEAEDKKEFLSYSEMLLRFTGSIIEEFGEMEYSDLYLPSFLSRVMSIADRMFENIPDKAKREEELKAFLDKVYNKTKEILNIYSLKHKGDSNAAQIAHHRALSVAKSILDIVGQFLFSSKSAQATLACDAVFNFAAEFISRRDDNLFDEAYGGSHGLANAVNHSDTAEELKKNVAALHRFLITSEKRLSENIPEYVIYNFMQKLSEMLGEKEGKLFAVYMNAMAGLMDSLDDKDVQMLFSKAVWVAIFDMANKLSPGADNLQGTFLELALLFKEMGAANIYLESAETYLWSFCEHERNLPALKEKVRIFLAFKTSLTKKFPGKEHQALINIALRNCIRNFSDLSPANFAATLASAEKLFEGIMKSGNNSIAEIFIENFGHYKSILLSPEKIEIAIAIMGAGFIPTEGLVEYAFGKKDLRGALEDFARVKRAISEGGFRLDKIDDPQEKALYIDVEYSHFVAVLLENGFGINRANYNNYRQFISGEHRPGEVHLGAAEIAEVDYAIFEAKRLLDFIDKLISQGRAVNREVVVVANMSYGGFVIDIIEEELARRGVRIIRTKIGSTESHQNPWVFREDLFSEGDLEYLVTNQPIMVVVDGTQHLVDREGDEGKRGRYPDAYQGYRNFALAFNEAIGSILGGQAARNRGELLGKDRTFVSAFGEDFLRLKNKIAAILRRLSGEKLYYDFMFWNPGGLRSILRENRQPLAEVDNVRPAQVKGPTIIFVNAVLVDADVPATLKNLHLGHEHEPAFFDDNNIIKEIFLSVTERGTQFEKKLKPIIRSRYPLVSGVLKESNSFEGAPGQVETGNLELLGSYADTVVDALNSGSLVMPVSVNSQGVVTVISGLVTVNGRQIRIVINNLQDSYVSVSADGSVVSVNQDKINSLLNGSNLNPQERKAAAERILIHDIAEAFAIQSGLNDAEAHTAGMMAEAMHPEQSQRIRDALAPVLLARDQRQARELADGRGYGGENSSAGNKTRSMAIRLAIAAIAAFPLTFFIFSHREALPEQKTEEVSPAASGDISKKGPLTIKLPVSSKQQEGAPDRRQISRNTKDNHLYAQIEALVKGYDLSGLQDILFEEGSVEDETGAVRLTINWNNLSILINVINGMISDGISIQDKNFINRVIKHMSGQVLIYANVYHKQEGEPNQEADNFARDFIELRGRIVSEGLKGSDATYSITDSIDYIKYIQSATKISPDLVPESAFQSLREIFKNEPSLYSSVVYALSSYIKSGRDSVGARSAFEVLLSIFADSKTAEELESTQETIASLLGVSKEEVGKLGDNELLEIFEKNRGHFEYASGVVSTGDLDSLGLPADTVIEAFKKGALVFPVVSNTNGELSLREMVLNVENRRIKIVINNRQLLLGSVSADGTEVHLNLQKINQMFVNTGLSVAERINALERIIIHEITEAYSLQLGNTLADSHFSAMMAEAMYPANSQKIRDALSPLLIERDRRHARQLVLQISLTSSEEEIAEEIVEDLKKMHLAALMNPEAFPHNPNPEPFSPAPFFDPVVFAKVFARKTSQISDKESVRRIFDYILNKPIVIFTTVIYLAPWRNIFWDVYANQRSDWKVRDTFNLRSKITSLFEYYFHDRINYKIAYMNILEYLNSARKDIPHSEMRDINDASRLVNNWIEKGVIIEDDIFSFMKHVEQLHSVAARSLCGFSAGKMRMHDVEHTDRVKGFLRGGDDLKRAMQNLSLYVAGGEFKSMPAVMQAALVYFALTDLQYFSDGNRRVAKLLMDYYLMRANLPPLEINQQNKNEFIKVTRFMKSPEELADFIADELHGQIERRQIEHENYILTARTMRKRTNRSNIDESLIGKAEEIPEAEKDLKEYLSRWLSRLGISGLRLPEIKFVNSAVGTNIPLFKVRLARAKDKVYLAVDISLLEKTSSGMVINPAAKDILILHEVLGHLLFRSYFKEETAKIALGEETDSEALFLGTAEEVFSRIMVFYYYHIMYRVNPGLITNEIKNYLYGLGLDINVFNLQSYAAAAVKSILSSRDPNLYRYEELLSYRREVVRVSEQAVKMASLVINSQPSGSLEEKESLRIMTKVTDQEAHALAEEVNSILGGKKIDDYFPRTLEAGGYEYAIESDATHEGAARVVRFGPIVFVVIGDIRESGDLEGLKREVLEKQNKLKSSKLYEKYKGNVIFVVPTFYDATSIQPISRYALLVIASMISNAGNFNDAVVFDAGAGDGLLSLVALRLGARKAVLIENNAQSVARSRILLSQESERVEIVQKDLADPELKNILGSYDLGSRPAVALVNIGPHEVYGKANVIALEMIASLPQLALIINGGHLTPIDEDIVPDSQDEDIPLYREGRSESRRILAENGFFVSETGVPFTIITAKKEIITDDKKDASGNVQDISEKGLSSERAPEAIGAPGQVETGNLELLGSYADTVVDALNSGSLVMPVSVNSQGVVTVISGLVTVNGRQIRIVINNLQDSYVSVSADGSVVSVNQDKINSLLNGSNLNPQERKAAAERILIHDIAEAFAIQSGLNDAEAHTAGMMAEAMHPEQSQRIRDALAPVLLARDQRQARELADGRGLGGDIQAGEDSGEGSYSRRIKIDDEGDISLDGVSLGKPLGGGMFNFVFALPDGRHVLRVMNKPGRKANISAWKLFSRKGISPDIVDSGFINEDAEGFYFIVTTKLDKRLDQLGPLNDQQMKAVIELFERMLDESTGLVDVFDLRPDNIMITGSENQGYRAWVSDPEQGFVYTGESQDLAENIHSRITDLQAQPAWKRIDPSGKITAFLKEKSSPRSSSATVALGGVREKAPKRDPRLSGELKKVNPPAIITGFIEGTRAQRDGWFTWSVEVDASQIDPFFVKLVELEDKDELVYGGGSDLVQMLLGEQKVIIARDLAEVNVIRSPEELADVFTAMRFYDNIDFAPWKRRTGRSRSEIKGVSVMVNGESSLDLRDYVRNYEAGRYLFYGHPEINVPLKHTALLLVTRDGRARIYFRTPQDYENYVNRILTMPDAQRFRSNPKELEQWIKENKNAIQGVIDYCAVLYTRTKAEKTGWKFDEDSLWVIQQISRHLTHEEKLEIKKDVLEKKKIAFGTERFFVRSLDEVLKEFLFDLPEESSPDAIPVTGEEEGKKGGIDFRSLPINTQPIPGGAFLTTPGKLVVKKDALELDMEWNKIQNMLNGKIIPSIERMREYILFSCQSDDCKERLDLVLSCIADILRLEEERCVSTESSLKQLLVLLESEKPAAQIKEELMKMRVSEKEPVLIN